MNNRFFTALSMLLSLAIVGFITVALLKILTFSAVPGVVVGLFAAQTGLLGFDLLLQGRKISAVLAFIPAAMGIMFAVMLFF